MDRFTSIIGGDFTSAPGDAKLVQSFRAGTNQVFAEGLTCSREQLGQAMQNVWDAFWQNFHDPNGVAARLKYFEYLVEELATDQDESWADYTVECTFGDPRVGIEWNRTIDQANKQRSWLENRLWLLPQLNVAAGVNLRTMLQGIGPGFGAGPNNFPWAFREAGGDRVAADAAGCPTLFKAHRSQLRTSWRQAVKINRARERAGLHPGWSQWLIAPRSFGPQPEDSLAHIVASSPFIKFGFMTGSQAGGEALYQAFAQNFKHCYTEMSAINPWILLPGYLADCWEEAADSYLVSARMGVGQFCTNPGLGIVVKGDGATRFKNRVRSTINSASTKPATMLDEGTCDGYWDGVERLGKVTGVSQFAGLDRSKTDRDKWEALPVMFSCSGQTFMDNFAVLSEEIFGPAGLVVEVDSVEEAYDCLAKFTHKGQLTTTLKGSKSELKSDHGRRLQSLCCYISGRSIQDFPGSTLGMKWPTGVAVAEPMVHGGPYPAATGGTAVGLFAPTRFTEAHCRQGHHLDVMPAELDDANSLGIMRLVNGVWTTDPVPPLASS